jgi:hypothetical protein
MLDRRKLLRLGGVAAGSAAGGAVLLSTVDAPVDASGAGGSPGHGEPGRVAGTAGPAPRRRP